MYRLLLALVLAVLGSTTALAQDWVSSTLDDSQYNCEVVNSLIEDYGDEDYARLDGAVLTVEEYHTLAVPGCMTESEALAQTTEPEFQVTVREIVNLRECAGTACNLVGRARNGDIFDVVGQDGDWFELKYENTTVFIAGWLTARLVDPPTGLLADFQFNALSPAGERWAVLYGSTRRTGTNWLHLTREDGSKTDLQVEALVWETDDTSNWFQRPVFFGWGGNDWELLPALIPDSSFYVYLPNDDEIHEFPVANSVYADSYRLGFDMTSRPASIRAGTPIRILVADSGQADLIKDWVALVDKAEVVAPPARPQPPTLEAGDGQVTVTIAPPDSGGAPITTYELRYREVGSRDFPMQVGSVSGEPYVIEDLTNGVAYQFAIAAINRGGKGPYSNFASATPSS